MTIRNTTEKSSATSSSFITHLYNYLHMDSIFVIRHHDDDLRGDRNMSVHNNNNNVIEHIYKRSFVGLSYISIKYSLMDGHRTHNRPVS